MVVVVVVVVAMKVVVLVTVAVGNVRRVAKEIGQASTREQQKQAIVEAGVALVAGEVLELAQWRRCFHYISKSRKCVVVRVLVLIGLVIGLTLICALVVAMAVLVGGIWPGVTVVVARSGTTTTGRRNNSKQLLRADLLKASMGLGFGV